MDQAICDKLVTGNVSSPLACSGNDLNVGGGARSRRSTNLHGQIPCNLGIYREFDGFVRM